MPDEEVLEEFSEEAGDQTTEGSKVTRTKVDGIDKQQYEWITAVIAGKSFVEALPKGPGFNTSRRAEESRAIRFLSDPLVRRRLVDGLILAGQIDRAREILTVASVRVLEEALSSLEGGARVKIAAAILGGPRASAAKARAAPTGVLTPVAPTGHRLPIDDDDTEENAD